MGKLPFVFGVVLIGCSGDAEPDVPVSPLDAAAIDATPAQDGPAATDTLDVRVVDAMDAKAVDAMDAEAVDALDAADVDAATTRVGDADAAVNEAGGDEEACAEPTATPCPFGYAFESCSFAAQDAGYCGIPADLCYVAVADAGACTFYCCLPLP
ncbi:MAG: hypothetical protein ABTD50_08115 [Polyangiaceae bacterium]|jgi:hypothetical protein